MSECSNTGRYINMREMIAYCGLDCEKCDAYLATINDDQALREKTAKQWAELNNAPILPEHINCQGCRVEGIKTVFCESMCGKAKTGYRTAVPVMARRCVFYEYSRTI